MTIRPIAALVLCCAAAPVADAAAQTLGTPVFQAPYRAFQRMELGGSFSDPGRGIVIEGHYRFASGPKYDFGLLAGLRDNDPGDSQLLIGGDFRTLVLPHSVDFPLDGALTVGVGAALGGGSSSVLIPVGLSLGRRIAIENSQVELTPFLHPVAALAFGDSNTDLIFGLGLGLNARLSRRVEFRVAGALGDYDGVSVGVSILR